MGFLVLRVATGLGAGCIMALLVVWCMMISKYLNQNERSMVLVFTCRPAHSRITLKQLFN